MNACCGSRLQNSTKSESSQENHEDSPLSAPLPGLVSNAGLFDFEHGRTVRRKDLGAEGACEDAGKVEDLDS